MEEKKLQVYVYCNNSGPFATIW